ncbi:hypothetical protein TNCV_251281 [Trichonephila clavipes]|nr:hypothetical protein TNCV_251281 [Trichonephila clavipes]
MHTYSMLVDRGRKFENDRTWHLKQRRGFGISVSLGPLKRDTTCRLTGAGSLQPPVYSEVWAKGIPRTPFSSLWDAAHGKHEGQKTNVVAAIRHISHSCLDPNDFTVVNCIVKGHASLSPPSLRLPLCSRFTLLATYTYFDPKDFSPHP